MLSNENFSVREAWSAIITVGLRPCSGALLVMTFSMLNGLYLGGLLSVLAMSVGTALTTSLLAIIAVFAKGTAVHFTGRGSKLSIWRRHGIEVFGALLVIFKRRYIARRVATDLIRLINGFCASDSGLSARRPKRRPG